MFNKYGCTFHTVFMGKGTAPSEIYEYLGVGVVEKDVIFSVVDSSSKDFLLNMLRFRLVENILLEDILIL